MNAILCAAFATMEDCEVGSQQMFGDSYEFKLRNLFWARGCFRVLAKKATTCGACCYLGPIAFCQLFAAFLTTALVGGAGSDT